MSVSLKINGVERALDVDAQTPLLWALRDTLELTGTKFGCGTYPRVRPAIRQAAQSA